MTVDLYAHYGIKSVSMNQVASTLHISKKTLYEKFGNKEELLCACVELEQNRITRILDRTENEAVNPVELIIVATSDLIHYYSSFCPSFHKDIQQFRNATLRHDSQRFDLLKRYSEYFHKGVAEGYFFPEFDYDAIAPIFLEQIIGKNNSHQSVMVFTFLRGLCTEKGLQALKYMAPDSIKKNVYDYN